MRNKANRLEELFVSLVNEKNKEIAHDASLLGGAKSIWAKDPSLLCVSGCRRWCRQVITMTLYFIIFGNLIGSRIGDMHGFSYMHSSSYRG